MSDDDSVCRHYHGHDGECDKQEPSSSPAVLWYQAEQEHPDDLDTRRVRYLELMREHGHIIKREPGDNSPLFSCGYKP